ncbi:hypothetical protein SAMN05216562_1039 [Microbulbifer marinus]|uniref:Uncharacterized protein n=1 Tax=Microbulbifer marinus TaxID=658218 RepID=A0A1H3WR00_9GAMM|nr:hypothetical protein SAMN05216562_1039 [Microbulbifer marinus]
MQWRGRLYLDAKAVGQGADRKRLAGAGIAAQLLGTAAEYLAGSDSPCIQ